MAHQRAHVVIPTELVQEIDTWVGQRKRSQFLVDAAQRELLRLKQLATLERCSGGWAKESHPELRGQGGSTRFVKKLRKESDRRL